MPGLIPSFINSPIVSPYWKTNSLPPKNQNVLMTGPPEAKPMSPNVTSAPYFILSSVFGAAIISATEIPTPKVFKAVEAFINLLLIYFPYFNFPPVYWFPFSVRGLLLPCLSVPVPANLQFAGAKYWDLQSLSMTVALMATSSFSGANIVVFSEKQGQNVYFQH